MLTVMMIANGTIKRRDKSKREHRIVLHKYTIRGIIAISPAIKESPSTKVFGCSLKIRKTSRSQAQYCDLIRLISCYLGLIIVLQEFKIGEREPIAGHCQI